LNSIEEKSGSDPDGAEVDLNTYVHGLGAFLHQRTSKLDIFRPLMDMARAVKATIQYARDQISKGEWEAAQIEVGETTKSDEEELTTDFKGLLRRHMRIRDIQNIPELDRVDMKNAIERYQPLAEKTARAIEVSANDNIWVENFSSNLFRADTIYLLSLWLHELKRDVMVRGGISGWQSLVGGKMRGKLHYIESISQIKEVGKEVEYAQLKVVKLDAPVTSYEAEIIKDGKEVELEIAADGTIIKQETEKKKDKDEEREEHKKGKDKDKD